VFDLGGGTLDTAVLQANDAGYAILGPPGGDPDLGGEDFDEMLLARVRELAKGRDRRSGPRSSRLTASAPAATCPCCAGT
jgi:molecular chaperone DnaK (HSP70)